MTWIFISVAVVLVLALVLLFMELESKRLQKGDMAPDFALRSQTNEELRLSQLTARGPVILYFYIQDATPG